MKAYLELDALYPLYSLWSERPQVAGKDMQELEIDLELMKEYVSVMEAFYKMQRRLSCIAGEYHGE
jgi:hypothetical protein